MLYHVSGYVGCAGVLGSIRGKVQKLLRGRESALDTRATRRPPVHMEQGWSRTINDQRPARMDDIFQNKILSERRDVTAGVGCVEFGIVSLPGHTFVLLRHGLFGKEKDTSPVAPCAISKETQISRIETHKAGEC